MRFLVIGAGGLSKEIADVLVALGHTPVAFYSEDARPDDRHATTGAPVIGTFEDAEYDAAVIAIGAAEPRKRLWDALRPETVFPTLVHPSASVSRTAQLGDGVVIMQNVVVEAAAVLGDDVLVNVGSFVGHDCSIGDHCHLAPGVLLSGGTTLGEGAFCAIGSTAVPLSRIGAWSVCAAGSVVTTEVPEGVVVMGVPARVTRDVGALDAQGGKSDNDEGHERA